MGFPPRYPCDRIRYRGPPFETKSPTPLKYQNYSNLFFLFGLFARKHSVERQWEGDPKEQDSTNPKTRFHINPNLLSEMNLTNNQTEVVREGLSECPLKRIYNFKGDSVGRYRRYGVLSPSVQRTSHRPFHRDQTQAPTPIHLVQHRLQCHSAKSPHTSVEYLAQTCM